MLNAGERRELEDDAYRRLERQIPDEQKTALCDYVLTNDGALTELEWQVEQLWPLLGQQAAKLTR
jgi:dephospho-CoA kinase